MHLYAEQATPESRWAASPANHPAHEKKKQFEEMFEEARQHEASLPEEQEERRRLEKFERRLGDEVRLTAGMILTVVSGFWIFQADLLPGGNLDKIFSSLKDFQFDAPWQSLVVIGEAMAACPQAVDPLGVSGWGVVLSAIYLVSSSVPRGWRMSLFALPAVILLLASFTATLCFQVRHWAAWAAFGVAITLSHRRRHRCEEAFGACLIQQTR